MVSLLPFCNVSFNSQQDIEPNYQTSSVSLQRSWLKVTLFFFFFEEIEKNKAKFALSTTVNAT